MNHECQKTFASLLQEIETVAIEHLTSSPALRPKFDFEEAWVSIQTSLITWEQLIDSQITDGNSLNESEYYVSDVLWRMVNER